MRKKIKIVKMAAQLQALRNAQDSDMSHKVSYETMDSYHIITHTDDGTVILQLRSFDTNIERWLESEIEFWS